MKVKFTIKTLEEFLRTEGINYKDSCFKCEDEPDSFLEEMFGLCGENYELDYLKDRVVIPTPYGKLNIYPWMCSTWELIKEDEVKQFKDTIFKLQDGTSFTIGVNQESTEDFLSTDSNIYMEISEPYVGITFDEWNKIDSKVREIMDLKNKLIEESL